MQIFLQYCYSAILKVELHCSSIVKKKKKFMMPFSPKIFLSSLSLFLFSSLFLLYFFICSLLSSDPNTILLPTSTSTSHTILHRWSFTKPLTHFHRWSFTRPLFHLSSHCSSTDSPSPISVVEASHDLSHISLVQSLHRCWVLDFGFWRLDQCGSTSWVWIDGLGLVDGGFGSVDRWVWNDGSVDRWVDRLGWSSVVPMVVPVMIFFWMGLLRWCCFSGVDRWVDHLLWWWFFLMVCDEFDRWVDCLLRFFSMIFCDGLMVWRLGLLQWFYLFIYGLMVCVLNQC